MSILRVYGGQIGIRAGHDFSSIFLNATATLVPGESIETASANGVTFTNIGGDESAPGGYLTYPTNFGSVTGHQLAVALELNVNRHRCL